MKRILLFGLLGGLLSIGSGCGLMQAVFCYRPCVDRGDCVSGCCGATCGDDCDDCGPAWGPAPAPRRAIANDCGVTRDRPVRSWNCYQEPGMDPCGECCQEHCWHRGPLSCVFALFARETWCGPTCGRTILGFLLRRSTRLLGSLRLPRQLRRRMPKYGMPPSKTNQPILRRMFRLRLRNARRRRT